MSLILHGGTVIDGRGGPTLPNGQVVIEGNRIQSVGPVDAYGSFDPAKDTRVDCNGKFVMPGMFNVHEHLDNRHGAGSFQERAGQPIPWLVLRGARNALLDLAEGVTTIRDVASKDRTNLIMRDAIRAGMILGPRVVACGQPIAMTGGHGWQICVEADGADAVRHAARQLLKEGADLIKLMASGGYIDPNGDQPVSPQFTIEEMRAGFEEAHKAGKKTTVHAHPAAAVIQAIEAGVDCIEHGILMNNAARGMMAEKNIFLVPTIAELAVIANRGAAFGRPAWMPDVYRRALNCHMENVHAAVAAGVQMAVGTDVIGTQQEEMSLMAEAGLSPMQVLVAATQHGARVCGLEKELGTLEVGKLADVIVIDGNPLERLSDISKVALVIQDGIMRSPKELKAATGRLPL